MEQELNNPNTAPYAKEVMATVLREHSRSVIPPNSIPNIPHAGSGITHKLHSPTTVNQGKQHSVQQQQGGVSNQGNFIANHHLPNTAILPQQQHSAVHLTSKPGNHLNLSSIKNVLVLVSQHTLQLELSRKNK